MVVTRSNTMVLLCNHPDSTYAKALLAALNARNVQQIHVVAMAPREEQRSVGKLIVAHHWRLPIYAIQWMWRKFVTRLSSKRTAALQESATLQQATEEQGGQYHVVSHINGEASQNVLKSLQVDLAVLAGAPIVRAPILEIPTIGTLNAHQGALPEFRGMNVIEWALLSNAQPALSIHFVNPGVDTGDILVVETVPIIQGDTLDTVRRRASLRQTELLAETAVSVLEGRLKGQPQKVDQGRQYFTMHPTIRKAAEQALQRTLSHELT